MVLGPIVNKNKYKNDVEKTTNGTEKYKIEVYVIPHSVQNINNESGTIHKWEKKQKQKYMWDEMTSSSPRLLFSVDFFSHFALKEEEQVKSEWKEENKDDSIQDFKSH